MGIAALKRLIIERTEGNPFFIEEMVQTLFEQGVLVRNGVVKLAKALDEIRVPVTVQAILASRIDRLPAPEKELLQTLAVLGREFPLDLIKRVAGKSDADLERMLSELQLAEFIYEQPAMGDIEYMFKHALTLEVAYNSVLIERRRLLHERAGQAMEELFADRLEDHVAELAHHYNRSGNARKAVEYLGRAGDRAAQQLAHSEAVGYFNRALELLKTQPDGMDRVRRELDLQMALNRSLAFSNAAAPAREPVLIRAQELSEQLGDEASLRKAILALAVFRFIRHEHGQSRELAQRVLGLAEQAKDAAMLAGAHDMLGTLLFFGGRLETAREHLERTIALLDRESLRDLAGVQLGAPGVLAEILCVLGYPAQALRKSGEFLNAMRRLSDPTSVARGLFFEAVVHTELRDRRTVLERADELLAIANQHEMRLYAARATFHRGWAIAGQEQGQEGIAEMCRAISALGTSQSIGTYYVALGESYANNGRPEEGLATVAEGLREGGQAGERAFEADLHRVKGELLLIGEPPDEKGAERCFRIAIDTARGQAARLFELRTTTSLARLLDKQGKRDQARAMLAEIYAWFTEGFECADLKDAKALLEELRV